MGARIEDKNRNEKRSSKVVIEASANKHKLSTKGSATIRSPEKKSRNSSLNTFDANDKEKAAVDSKNVQTDTPTSSRYFSKRSGGSRVNIVTPSTSDLTSTKRINLPGRARVVRRLLSIPPLLREVSDGQSPFDLTESGVSLLSSDGGENRKHKRFPFGRAYEGTIAVRPNTRKVYSVVSRMTGSIGGNGNGGAIYGELTMGSMQKIVDLMKEHANLNENSRFIDVGCGLGKPNLHVAQDPGVQFSYGVEMEHVRWVLAMCNLNQVFDVALKQKSNEIKDEDMIGHRCVFEHGDITDADYMDPFTHVYMFDIGFPPKLFKQLATMFNRSQSLYLICYHGPKLMIDRYGFAIELLVQAPTSMHGSSEGHMGYIYRRVKHINRNRIKKKCPILNNNKLEDFPCDPMFAHAWKSTRRNLEHISMDVKKAVINNLSSSRSKRNRIPTCK